MGKRNTDGLARHVDLDALFFQTPAQVTELVREFAERILAGKSPDRSLLTPYATFQYGSELGSISWPEDGVTPAEFLDKFADYFQNVVNYDAPGVLYNVHPNVNLVSQVASFITSIANPNFCMDIPAGKLLVLEKAVTSYLASLAGWSDEAGGVFTFGGKGTLLYALKLALLRAEPTHRDFGLKGAYRVLSNVLGHPSHVEICSWTGIGQNACLRLPVVHGRVEAEEVERSMISAIEQGMTVPLIIVNGMSVNNHTFDPVAEIAEARDRVSAMYGLDYKPWIHVDSVLGWVYLTASQYDFEGNPLALPERSLEKIHTKAREALSFGLADSFAADFHKTGFCSYSSSALVVKNKDELFSIQGHYSEGESLQFTQYAPYDFTLESSRSGHGPVSAFATLQTLGVNGFTQILSNQTVAFSELKRLLSDLECAVVCNLTEESNLVFVAFLPNGVLKSHVKEDMSDELARKVREFNVGLHAYLMSRLADDSSPLFFSISRSYLFKGHALGCLKLYSFNSTLTGDTATATFNNLVRLLSDYLANTESFNTSNSFDFTRVGESGHV